MFTQRQITRVAQAWCTTQNYSARPMVIPALSSLPVVALNLVVGVVAVVAVTLVEMGGIAMSGDENSLKVCVALR